MTNCKWPSWSQNKFQFLNKTSSILDGWRYSTIKSSNSYLDRVHHLKWNPFNHILKRSFLWVFLPLIFVFLFQFLYLAEWFDPWYWFLLATVFLAFFSIQIPFFLVRVFVFSILKNLDKKVYGPEKYTVMMKTWSRDWTIVENGESRAGIFFIRWGKGFSLKTVYFYFQGRIHSQQKYTSRKFSCRTVYIMGGPVWTVQTEAILFLSSMSERNGTDI